MKSRHVSCASFTSLSNQVSVAMIMSSLHECTKLNHTATNSCHTYRRDYFLYWAWIALCCHIFLLELSYYILHGLLYFYSWWTAALSFSWTLLYNGLMSHVILVIIEELSGKAQAGEFLLLLVSFFLSLCSGLELEMTAKAETLLCRWILLRIFCCI